jgi:hypothetical protein
MKEHSALKNQGYNHDKRRKKWNYGKLPLLH